MSAIVYKIKALRLALPGLTIATSKQLAELGLDQEVIVAADRRYYDGMADAPHSEKDAVSKREHFAALAMQGEIAASAQGGAVTPEGVADFAVKCADALLAELEATS